MDDAGRQKAVGCLVLGGALAFVGGILLTVMLFGSAALSMARSQGTEISMLVLTGIGPGVMIIGLLSCGAGLTWGFIVNRQATQRPPMRYPYSRVMARYAMMPGTDEMMFSEFHPEDEGIRFFVQVRLPDGRTPELQCPFAVFEQMGEGMWGEATVQGDWIGAFRPSPSPPSE